MEEFKGTKGEWKPEGWDDTWWVFDDKGNMICSMSSKPGTPKKANAKLIAASKEILNRLMATNEVLRDLIDDGTLPEADEAIIERNIKAINKALK